MPILNYYNENDPTAAEWLRWLMADGEIPYGHIDTRSITEIEPNDLKPYTQCHFFAGIGGWSYALRLAAWPDDRPVWTGSCPCQPFSVAGKGKGVEDERHLWPAFARLISECNPPVVFGEQVASKAGRQWLNGVRLDLEGLGYAVGAADLCAAGLGAPHIRQRLYWVAYAQRNAREQGRFADQPAEGAGEAPAGAPVESRRLCDIGGVVHPQQQGLERHTGDGDNGHQSGREHTDAPRSVATASGLGGMANTTVIGRSSDTGKESRISEGSDQPLSSGGTAWDSFDLLPCLDGKTRRIESGTFPLAHGVPGRVGLLRGYGNAIVPQVAATFIEAFLET